MERKNQSYRFREFRGSGCHPPAGTWFSKRVLWTILNTLHAQNTLRSVLSFPRVVRYINIHRADLFSFPAGYTFICIAFYPQQGEITHGLEKYRDRTNILTECPVVFEQEC